MSGKPAQARVAPALGWASLGLGLPQVAVPGRFLRLIGARQTARGRAALVGLVGVRELAAAAGILVLERQRPVRSLWARVAGDAVDLALLILALRSKPESRGRLVASMGAVAGIGAADVFAASRLGGETGEPAQEEEPMHVTAAITVWRPREEVYEFWRDFRNLPSFMYHLESVEVEGDGRSRWRARAPAGRTVEWNAEVVEESPNESISWRSVPGSGVANSGSVRFVAAPEPDGTEIHLELHYDPPGGTLGAIVAKLFGEEPTQQVKDDLRRLKQVMETGEVVRSEGSPEGQVAARMLKQRPAHPLDEPVGAGGSSS